MSHLNSPVLNLRQCQRAKSGAANKNGFRNAIFLPGVGPYKGMWKNNLREGLGTLTMKNGVIYDGNWMNDKKHGYGLLKKKLKSQRGNYAPIYDGEWKFDKRHGDGTAYYKNGFYEGQWKRGCRDGLGIMSFCDGSYFIGEWKNDLYDGIGAYKDVSGETSYKGYFRNGKKCGEGTLNYRSKGQIQKGIWMDGSCAMSIIQNDGQNENVIPSKNIIPKSGLANPVNVIAESLQSKVEQNDMTKLREKQMENFNRFQRLQ